MYMSHSRTPAGNKASNAYARIGIETAVMSASPHQLITLLFDGAKAAITMARYHMANSDIEGKGNAISKAINIVGSGLKASLDASEDPGPGGELVANLAQLYDYVIQCLLNANLHNDPTKLDEAERLLDNIGSAWREIEGKTQQQGGQSLPAQSRG
ncbi:flagellar export chaperone FliS [Glaciimonas sp. PAMC28666]|uniref:flagellar export chaperone FliS n=1 Tax=Glaciimonas sp. PAMC28666 TaxID=2807626 RepID=UPI001964BA2A|nr:flagellar export chaperone FliS [Glaciimonas sp. PAMC28666]QRX83155.1 flagellar export chaperone FliS [Glaciimonas sp. PAMC28666]